MLTKPFSLSVDLHPYLAERNTPPTGAQQSLIEIAASMEAGGMKTNTEAGSMLTLLTMAIQPRFAVEVGTFIGYSSLCIARALPDDGRLLCMDVSDEWTSIAREHWSQAGVAHKVDLVLAPAAETLAALPAEPTVDFAFVDADKGGYITYYNELVPRLSPHGIIAVDNTMWNGRVIDVDDTSVDTVAVRAFNDHVAADERTFNVTIPVGDGITLIGLAASVG